MRGHTVWHVDTVTKTRTVQHRSQALHASNKLSPGINLLTQVPLQPVEAALPLLLGSSRHRAPALAQPLPVTLIGSSLRRPCITLATAGRRAAELPIRAHGLGADYCRGPAAAPIATAAAPVPARSAGRLLRVIVPGHPAPVGARCHLQQAHGASLYFLPSTGLGLTKTLPGTCISPLSYTTH